MSTPYAARYAEFYDLFYRDKPYAKEVHFINRLLRRHGVERGGHVVEFACGTGEHALRLAALGYRVTATDSSGAMIALARQKALRRKTHVTFERRDMRESVEPAGGFDAALCLFDSIGYLRTDRAVGDALESVHNSLGPDGVFIVEFWHAPAMLNGFEPVRVRRYRNGRSDILRISETTLDRRRSLAQVAYNVYQLRADSTYDHFAERHTNRYFTVPEMTRLARAHGFTPLKTYDGFSRRRVSDQGWHVLSVWKKARRKSTSNATVPVKKRPT